ARSLWMLSTLFRAFVGSAECLIQLGNVKKAFYEVKGFAFPGGSNGSLKAAGVFPGEPAVLV
ncbi:MAG TPA: hypothetical protein VI112_13840, partial [Bacteroidia bacterium]